MFKLDISNLIRVLSPDFALNLKLIDTLNIDSFIKIDAQTHIHCPMLILPNGIRVESTSGQLRFHPSSAVLIPNQLPDPTNGIGAVALAVEGNTDTPISQAARLPFRQCAHFRIDRPAWWDDAEQITLGATRLVSARPAEEVSVFTGVDALRAPVFWACADQAGDLTVSLSIAGKRQPDRRVTSGEECETGPQKRWRFTRYEASAFIRLADLDETVISFDPQIVAGAWMIERQNERSGQHDHYLIVIGSVKKN